MPLFGKERKPKGFPAMPVHSKLKLISGFRRYAADHLARRWWGQWYFDSATLTLAHIDDTGGCRYWIDLSALTSTAAALDWVVQISQKRWASRADIGDLVEALDDLLDMQQTMCGGAMTGTPARTLNAAAYLRAKYPEGSI